MQQPPSTLRFHWPLAARFTGLALLIALLLVSPSIFARTTHHHRHRAHHARQSHSVAHRVRHRHSHAAVHRIALRHSRSRRHSARMRRVARHRRRSRRDRYYRAVNRHHTHLAPKEERMDRTEEAVAALPSDDAMHSPMPISTSTAAEIDRPAASLNVASSNARIFMEPVPRIMPVALRGTHEVLVHQNIIADVEGLSRIQDDAQLNAMVRSGDLVPLPASSALVVDPSLPSNRRYCRPWTAKFLTDLARAHERVFGDPLQLTSAVRTVSFQRRLSRYNANAAPTSGDTASPHLTGEAVDLGKKGMSRHEIAWMRNVLAQLQADGKLDVEEEFHQACFHISVYETYAPRTALPATLVASTRVEAPPQTAHEDSVRSSQIETVSLRAEHRSRTAHVRRAPSRAARRAAIRRRRRRHHTSMSLLAARMR